MVQKTKIHNQIKAKNKAIDLMTQGKASQALNIVKKNFKASSDIFLFFKGWSYEIVGDYTKAIKYFEKAIIANPANYDAMFALASCYQEIQEYTHAIECAEQCVLLDSNSPKSYYILGTTTSRKYRRDQERLKQASSYFSKAYNLSVEEHNIELSTDILIAWGACLVDLRDYPKAKLILETVLKHDKYNVLVNKNLASVYLGLNDVKNSAEACKIASMSEQPSIKFDALCQLGMVELMRGNYSLGWRLYEHRLNVMREELDNIHPYQGMRKWNGKPRKRVLLYQEQGIGDTVQFSRYINLALECVEQVDVAVNANAYLKWEDTGQPPDSLKNIFESTYPGINKIYIRGYDDIDLTVYDAGASLMSLPSIFKTTLKTIPETPKFITSKINPKIQELPQYNVGLVWRGSKTFANDLKRSAPTSLAIDYVKSFPELSFLSLQLEATEEFEHLSNVKEGGQYIKEFDDTLQLVNKCDLIVSVDSMLAHFAASAKRPVFILHAYSPDWRWMLNRDDSPWYPTVTNLRQDSLDDWGSVFDKLKLGTKKYFSLKL